MSFTTASLSAGTFNQ